MRYSTNNKKRLTSILCKTKDYTVTPPKNLHHHRVVQTNSSSTLASNRYLNNSLPFVVVLVGR